MKSLVISAGLMGGSIAKALVKFGWEVHATTRKFIKYDGISFYTNFDDIPKLNYDVICVASPRGKNWEIYYEIFEKIQKFCNNETYIVDISSVQNENENLQKLYKNFVPCHPIAGTEKSGFENSSSEILFNKTCLVIKENPPEKVLQFWKDCGMVVNNQITSCQKHDIIFAKISHLPQLLSFHFPRNEQVEFKDFYRLKNSSKTIWNEIFLQNKENILKALQQFIKKFNEIKNDAKSPWEVIISNVFQQITTDEEQSFSGSGFKTVTSAQNFPKNQPIINIDETKCVENIIQDSINYLVAEAGFEPATSRL